MTTTDKRIKISNHERLIRIMKKVSNAKLTIFIRIKGDDKIKVKGNVLKTIKGKKSTKISIEINKISKLGINYLKEKKEAIFELVISSTKIAFNSKILAITDNSITVSFPKSMVSVERRNSPRYKTNETCRSYLTFENYTPKEANLFSAILTNAFCENQHGADLGAYLFVNDLSTTGVCIETYFSDINTFLKPNFIDTKAHIILPKQLPIPIRAEIKWSRKVKEFIGNNNNTDIFKYSYKFGIEFQVKDESKLIDVRKYIKSIIQSEAI